MKVLVFGMGVSGKSVAEYFLKKGDTVFTVDKKEENDAFSLIDEADFMVKSPGISWDHPLVKAAEKKIPILSEIEIALRELKKKKKILLGITGSNGKTTTTMLTTHILNHCGKKAVSVGNIGTTLISKIDGDEDILVIELSSYQIETLSTVALDHGAILNITPNHLERYPSFEKYALAKLHLEKVIKKGGTLFLHKAVASEFGQHVSSYSLFPALHPTKEIEENVATIFPLRYRDGRFSHDFENCQVAFALCNKLGISEKECFEGIKTFKKPHHRLEFVANLNGITYVNDSKATTVEAVIRAVDSVTGNVILIAGGIDKGCSYRQWSSALKEKVRKVLLIGRSREKLFNEITPELEAEKLETLEEAIKRASSLAKKGETILLSPGCASFDQFQNFEHRGDVFKKLVFALEGI